VIMLMSVYIEAVVRSMWRITKVSGEAMIASGPGKNSKEVKKVLELFKRGVQNKCQQIVKGCQKGKKTLRFEKPGLGPAMGSTGETEGVTAGSKKFSRFSWLNFMSAGLRIRVVNIREVCRGETKGVIEGGGILVTPILVTPILVTPILVTSIIPRVRKLHLGRARAPAPGGRVRPGR
jgi:hypothetical protein